MLLCGKRHNNMQPFINDGEWITHLPFQEIHTHYVVLSEFIAIVMSSVNLWDKMTDCGSKNNSQFLAPSQRTTRQFRYFSMQTVEFAVPSDSTDELSTVEYLGGGSFGNVIKITNFICVDGRRTVVAIKKLYEPFRDEKTALRVHRIRQLFSWGLISGNSMVFLVKYILSKSIWCICIESDKILI